MDTIRISHLFLAPPSVWRSTTRIWSSISCVSTSFPASPPFIHSLPSGPTPTCDLTQTTVLSKEARPHWAHFVFIEQMMSMVVSLRVRQQHSFYSILFRLLPIWSSSPVEIWSPLAALALGNWPLRCLHPRVLYLPSHYYHPFINSSSFLLSCFSFTFFV